MNILTLINIPFKNFFKSSNYLGSTDDNASSTIGYYELNVIH